MSIASQLGLAPKKGSIADQVGLIIPTTTPTTGTPIGSGVSGGTLVSDPTSPSGAREVPMSPATPTTSTSSRRSSSFTPSTSQITQTQEPPNMSPSAGYIQQPVSFQEPKVTTTSQGFSSYAYTGTVDYTGLKQQRGETREQFEARVQSTVSQRAELEASRIASTKPKGSEITVELRYTSPLFEERPSNIAKIQPTKEPYEPFKTKTEPKFVVKTQKEPKELSAKAIVLSAEFGAQKPKGDVVVATKNVAGLTIGGVSPKIKPTWAESAAFQIESKLVKSAKYEGLSKEQFVSAFRDPKVTPVVGSVTSAGRFIKSEVVPLITKPVSGAEGATYSRSGDFIVGGAVSAVGDVLIDPLKYSVLYVSGSIAGVTIGSAAGITKGVISGSPALSGALKTAKPFLQGSGIVIGAGVGGLVAYDVAKSDNRIDRFGTIIAEGVSFGASFTPAVKSSLSFVYETKGRQISQTMWNKRFTEADIKLGTFKYEGVSGVRQTGASQSTLYGGFIPETELRSTSLVFSSTPMGLPSGVTYQAGRAPILPKGVGVTRVSPFDVTTFSESGKVIPLYRYGAQSQPFSSSTSLVLLDTQGAGAIRVSPKGYARLLESDPSRFKFVSGEDLSRPALTPRFNYVDTSVQSKLAFDVSTQELSFVIPKEKSVSVSQGFLFKSKKGQVSSLAFDLDDVQKGLSFVSRSVVSGADDVLSYSTSVKGRTSPFTAVIPRSVFKEEDVKIDVVSRSFIDKDVFSKSVVERETSVSEKSVTGFAFVPKLGVENLASSQSLIGSASVVSSRGASRTSTGLVSESVSVSQSISSSALVSVAEGVSRPSPVTSRFGGFRGGRPSGFILPPVVLPNLNVGRVSGFRPQVGERSGFFGAWKTASPGREFLTRGVETLRLGGVVPNRVGVVVNRDVRSPRRKKREFWWDVGWKL